MDVEAINSEEKIASSIPHEEHSWNGHHVSSYEKRREKELQRLQGERPPKQIDPQGYYLCRAREEQLRYELDFRSCGVELLRGNYYESMTLYGHALNHLKRRGKYEEKIYAIWLQRVKAQEHPPTPDIYFINHGRSA